jgi:hypothetical protein
MITIGPANVRPHQPGSPCPVPGDTPVWVLRVGSSTFYPFRADMLNWENVNERMDDIVLAWAPVVTQKEEN